MAVNVGIIGDRDAVPENDASAIIQQHMAMNDDVIANFNVVAERELNMLEALEILATAAEYVGSEQTAETNSELDVLSSKWRAVKRVPKPQKRLDLLKTNGIAVRIVLGLKSHIARIQH
jgi:hypothetical protein